jgi:hypothetical protein
MENNERNNSNINNIQTEPVRTNKGGQGKKGKIQYEGTGDDAGDKQKPVTKPMNEIKIDKSKIKNAHKLVINGIEVYFPYKPYQNQILYMEKGRLFSLIFSY